MKTVAAVAVLFYLGSPVESVSLRSKEVGADIIRPRRKCAVSTRDLQDAMSRKFGYLEN